MTVQTPAYAPAQFVPEGLWAVDPAASSAHFSVKHLMVATVHGTFRGVFGTISATGRGVHADGGVQVATIDTGMAERDARLRGPGFFDAERFPDLHFSARAAERVAGGRWAVDGDLTAMGRSAPLQFTVAVFAGDDGPRIRAHASLSRRAHGLDWPGLLHSGTAVVGDRVAIELDLVCVRGFHNAD